MANRGSITEFECLSLGTGSGLLVCVFRTMGSIALSVRIALAMIPRDHLSIDLSVAALTWEILARFSSSCREVQRKPKPIQGQAAKVRAGLMRIRHNRSSETGEYEVRTRRFAIEPH